MTIELKCPRCGTMVKAPESKAGTKGRCPICGGAIKVPKSKKPAAPAPVLEAPPVASGGHQIIWAGAAGVILLIVFCVIMALGHRAGSPVGAKTGAKALTPEAQEKLRRDLLQFAGVEGEIQGYQQGCVQEKRLRARAVLAKRNHYEPVTAFEDELRRQVLEEQARTAAPRGDNGIPKDEWRLNTPLAPSEQPELDRLSSDLERRAAKLKDDLAALGIAVTLSDDPLGRMLLDGDDAEAKVAARKEQIRKEALESAN